MTDTTAHPLSADGDAPPRPATRSARRCRPAPTARRWAWGVPLWLLALLFLLPFAWMISTSLKPDADAFLVPMSGSRRRPLGELHRGAVRGDLRSCPSFANSVLVAVMRVLGELATATLAGYAFATLLPRAEHGVHRVSRDSLIPAQLLLVPRFVYFQQLGLTTRCGP